MNRKSLFKTQILFFLHETLWGKWMDVYDSKRFHPNKTRLINSRQDSTTAAIHGREGVLCVSNVSTQNFKLCFRWVGVGQPAGGRNTRWNKLRLLPFLGTTVCVCVWAWEWQWSFIFGAVFHAFFFRQYREGEQVLHCRFVFFFRFYPPGLVFQLLVESVET